MPHAPILIPELAAERAEEVRTTIHAMKQIGREIVEAGPQTVILISPHAPRRQDDFGWYASSVLRGGLIQFGRPQALFEYAQDRELAALVQQECANHPLHFRELNDNTLDHGATVPIYFLWEAGWQGELMVIGLGSEQHDTLMSLGQCLDRAIDRSQKKMALIASGDMSHRVTRNAPAGYHPDAASWDRQLIQKVQSGDAEAILCLDPEARRQAAEDSVSTLTIAIGALPGSRFKPEVLAYEAPFGVGYGTARLHAITKDAHVHPTREERPPPWHLLPSLARRAVMRHLSMLPPSEEPELDPLKGIRAGVFVTIRTREGDLRGCMGTIQAERDSVIQETVSNAVSSAMRDRRFRPVTADEMEDLRFEVSVLSAPRPVQDRKTLDPKKDGLILQAIDGSRGLMLPDIPELDTVEKQIQGICRKTGMQPEAITQMSSFRVEKYQEPSS